MFIINIIFIMLNPQTQCGSRWSEGIFIFRSLSLACPTFNTRGKVHLCHRQRPLVFQVFGHATFRLRKIKKRPQPTGQYTRGERKNMKKLEKYVDEMLDTGKKPRGFTNNQAQTLIDIYYSLCNNTRTFLW